MTEEQDRPTLSKAIKIAKLRNGAVIDPLRPGPAMQAIQVLGVSAGSTALPVGMYQVSSKIGHKDILKIENRTLTPDEINKIAVLSPEATLCNIRDYQVVDKIKAHLPPEIMGIIRCNNPKCITNHERITTRFMVLDDDPIRVQCRYCERFMTGKDIELL